MKQQNTDFLREYLRNRSQADAFIALRTMGFACIEHPHPDVRAVAAMIIRLTTERNLEALGQEIGLVAAGSTASQAVVRRWRNVRLRRIRRDLLAHLGPTEAAREIARRHRNYEAVRARRDERQRRCDGDEIDEFFFHLRRLKVALPERDEQLMRIFNGLD